MKRNNGDAGIARAPAHTDQDPTRLGASIRAARNRAGLSQRELARQLSLSPAMISQLEKGHSQPSVTTLLAIARTLEVSLDSLFSNTVDESMPRSADDHASSADQPAWSDLPPSGTHFQVFGATDSTIRRRPVPGASIDDMVTRHDGDRSLIKMQSGVTWELLTPDQKHPLMFMLVTYPPGASTSADGEFVRHTDFEYFYLMEGQLDVYIDFEHTVVRAGDSMWFDSTRPHNFENNGTTEVRGVWCLLPQL